MEQINILIIIVALLLLFNIINGLKKGMVREIISFISLLISGVVFALIANGIHNYMDGHIINVVIVVLALSAIGIARHLLGIVFFSAKVISKLPVISWADKLFGGLVGFFETIAILWIVYAFAMMFDMGMVGRLILEYTAESDILTWIYERNYLMLFLQNISSNIHLNSLTNIPDSLKQIIA